MRTIVISNKFIRFSILSFIVVIFTFPIWMNFYFHAHQTILTKKLPESKIINKSNKNEIIKIFNTPIVFSDFNEYAHTNFGEISMDEPSQTELRNYISVFISEFQLYPDNLIRKANLNRIVFCKNLKLKGKKIGGIFDYEKMNIYFDIEFCNSMSLYQRKSIHHEMFHVFDWQDDSQKFQDENWNKLNDPSFRYGSGGLSMQENKNSGVWTSIPGFLSEYSMSGVEEDKAEVFSFMMVDFKRVMEISKSDHIIRNKLSNMRIIMNNFSADANDRFWDNVRSHCDAETLSNGRR